MKLYTCSGAPSPRRVALYLAAKNIGGNGDSELDIDLIEVNLRTGEHLSDEFAARSPDCTVPVLELDDGRCLWETGAIRRYLEERYPDPPLFGATPEARAEVNQWTDWVFSHGLLAVMEAFRNASPGFRDHALTGRRPVAQIPALAERGRLRFGHFLDDLEARLAASAFVGGDQFSVADIDALATVDFATRAIRIKPDADRHPALVAWHKSLSTRFSGQ